jgi:hypothetical protein
MSVFLLEIWSDLKAKRLWPVAVLLVVALAAVPFVLAKPAEEPPPAAEASAPIDATAGAAQLLPADLEAAKPLLQTSTLSEFNSKNPFKPLRTLKKIEQAAGVESTTTEDATADSGADTGPTDGGGSGGTTPDTFEEEKTVFTYQVIVEVSTADGTDKRVVNRLGILPSETNPLLVFLGVSADDNGEAVFLVDSTLTQAGEGRCRPSATTCSFLYLTTQDDRDEHIFTDDDGKEYSIKLLAVRRVQVKAAQASEPDPVAQAGDADADLASTDVAPTPVSTDLGEGPVEDPFEGFGFPLFADEEE